MQQSLVDYVRSHIDPKDYYSHVFTEIDWTQGEDPRVKCCFHDDSTPSLHVNATSGKWYCHGCEAGGRSIVSFESLLHQNSHDEAATALFHRFIHPIIPAKKIRSWHRKLLKTPSAVRYLKGKRLLSAAIIDRYKLGFDGERFIIPIHNEFGLCVNAKLYQPRPKGNMPKMLNYSLPDKEEPRHFGKPVTIYPRSVLKTVQESGDDETTLIICEGEWDTLALLSIGVPAVTSTGGAKSWPAQLNDEFSGLHVCVAYDNDPEGERYFRKPIRAIRQYVRSAKRIRIPKRWGKDVTDWITNSRAMRKRTEWLRRIGKAKTILENPESAIPTTEFSEVALQDSSSSEWHKRPIRVQALVTGKDTVPYLVPKTFRISCAKTCDTCPLREVDSEYRTCTVNPEDPVILKLIDIPEDKQRRLLMILGGFGHAKPKCKVQVEVLDSYNVEQLLVIPTLDSSSGEYTIRPVYYTGHGIHSNRAYAFSGKPFPHPRDQHATCLFNNAVPVQDAIETFELTPEMVKALAKFKTRENLLDHLMDIAEWQSGHITHIRERPDLHIAIDLAFHSVAAFEFNGEQVKRGMLDVLILGDTRCGKGYVSEGLIDYYGLGEIASGENCSFAGLVGGLQQSGNRWFVTWGLIPLNNNRIVVIDEASALSTTDIGRMSRVRSEGIAEISKIVREVTQANTRLIWCANPRSGHPLMTYNSGAQAIKELIGSNEDISRFDYALTVASDEVASEVINVMAHRNGTEPSNNRFPRELCKSLILWAWSRSPDQIKFTPAATKAIIRCAIELGEQYSATIPLVQSENIRIKIAKISAAIAARVFSADKTGERLIINAKHVRCTCQVLEMFYTKDSMRYHTYSEAAHEASTIEDTQPIKDVFNSLSHDRQHLIDGLLTLQEISPDSVADYVGDTQMARMVISSLVKNKCLTRQGPSNYTKNPAFVEWLRAEKQ